MKQVRKLYLTVTESFIPFSVIQKQCKSKTKKTKFPRSTILSAGNRFLAFLRNIWRHLHRVSFVVVVRCYG